MKSFKKVMILWVFIFCYSTGFTQNIQLKSKFEKIEIKEDSTFINEISILFKKSDAHRLYPIFYDTELEKVSNIRLYAKKGRRLKKLPVKDIIETDAKLDYITSKKIKSVIIPPNKEVKLIYTVTCKELMYFSSLHFFSYNEIDTLAYQIKVPKKFEFAHHTIHKDALPFYSIDSTKTNTTAIWTIKVAPLKVKPDPMQLFGIYKNMKVPLMRTLVMPSSYKSHPIKYMNDWYYKNTASSKGLNALAKRKIDELTVDVTDTMALVHIIYKYIKNNFKYVAIEIGMGAFIPSHVNDVFINKQGDCKDLSNLLSEALLYKGIKNDIALAATFDHITDCDFPSLSSANHVICVAYVKGKKILLDPTDPIHREGTPVQSLQKRTIFIINDNGGSFYKAINFSPKQNEISYQLNLNADSNNMSLEGTFDVTYNGISGNYLKRYQANESKPEFENYGKLHFEKILGNQSITNFIVPNKNEQLHFKGNISINGKIFNDGKHKYVLLDYLPSLVETESRETLLEGTYLKNPFRKKVSVKLNLDEPIELFKAIKHNYKGNGISLEIKISAISNTEIQCNYDFIFNHIFINKENINKTNEVLKSFNKIINEPIILKKQ